LYLRLNSRKNVRKKLLYMGVDSKNDSLSNCPELEIFSGGNNGYDVSHDLVKTNFQLPNFPSLKEKHMYKIVDSLKSIL